MLIVYAPKQSPVPWNFVLYKSWCVVQYFSNSSESHCSVSTCSVLWNVPLLKLKKVTSSFHCILSWQRENQQLSMLMADSTPSRQRFLVPWKGCVLCNSPNRSCLGGLSSFIRPRWPSQRSRLSIIKSATDHCRPNASDKFLVVIRCLYCWYLVTPKIAQTRRLWKVVNLLKSGAFIGFYTKK